MGFLRLGLRTVLVFGLVLALAGFFTGRSTTAVRARGGLSKGIGYLRGGAEKAGLRTGPVGSWVYTYKRVLQFVTLGIAALVLVFWDRPTGKVIIVLALCVLVVLAIIEFLGRPPSPVAEVQAAQEAEVAGPEGTGPGAAEPEMAVVDVNAPPRNSNEAVITVDPQRSPPRSDV